MITHGIFRLIILAAIGVGLLTPRGQGPTNREQLPILSERVGSFHIENGTMEEGLRTLRQTNKTRILIGLEKVAHRQNEKEKTLSLSLSGATVDEILNGLCQQDPRYTYQIASGLLIHVYPKNGLSDPAGLLSLRVSRFSIANRVSPAAVIQRIGELAPELASYMSNQQAEYYAQHALSPPGSPGAYMSGNMDPQIHLDLHDVTVREILNAVVLYSQQLNEQTSADWTGNKIPPSSWIYDFIIDPAAPTGLGGTPHWEAF
ncbi:MAG TPA: hypothetical protein VOA64_08960 [Candidatus Dormibacteraeota bacterium]|nr:hypothetical protein [Candidatus Dormibacteraeota bacterium]